MNPNSLKQNLTATLSIGAFLVVTCLAAAQAPRDGLESLRADLKADRKVIIANEMSLTPQESEDELLSIKRKYLKKFGKVLPPSKVFRFAQLDNRLDLGTRVGLASSIPLMPAEPVQPAKEQR